MIITNGIVYSVSQQKVFGLAELPRHAIKSEIYQNFYEMDSDTPKDDNISEFSYFNETANKLSGHSSTGLTQVSSPTCTISSTLHQAKFFFSINVHSYFYQVRLVSLVGKQFDYCVYQCFSTTMSSLDIRSVIRDTINALSVFHFRVVSVIGDGAQCNRQFQKKYFTDEMTNHNGMKFDNLMKEPIYDNPIFYISDPSHMIKKIVSSLSSNSRNIFKEVNGKNHQVSLSNMMNLWMGFNSSGLNEFPDFKSIDFIKNSFQAMRVGPCIKVRLILQHDLKLNNVKQFNILML